jgi:single-strand DNA-binding protein
MFNKVILVGRLTADPELKQTPNGVSVTTFAIAVDRPFTPKDGGDRQVDFIDIVAWRNTAEFVSRYFAKGRAILIEGALQIRSFTDKNDQKRRVYEVVADNCRFVGDKNSSSGGGYAPSDADAPPARNAPAQMPAASYSSGSADDFSEIDDDGDLPF